MEINVIELNKFVVPDAAATSIFSLDIELLFEKYLNAMMEFAFTYLFLLT